VVLYQYNENYGKMVCFKPNLTMILDILMYIFIKNLLKKLQEKHKESPHKLPFLIFATPPPPTNKGNGQNVRHH